MAREWRLVIFLLLSFGLMSMAHAEQRDPYQHFFQETFGDFQEELELAAEEDKKALLVFFEMDECPFCHRMKKTVLNQAPVQDYYRANFRIISLDIEGDIEVTDFAGNVTTQKDFAFKQHKVRATPVFSFFDLEGQAIARYTGPTSGTEEFLWLGEFVADGHYKTTKFTRYKRAKRKESAQ